MGDVRTGGIETSPWITLRNVSHLITQAIDKELQKLDLTARQMTILGLIKSIGPDIIPADISRRLLRKPSSISNILVRMEKKGLITRVQDTENNTQLRVSLTDMGEERYKNANSREVIKRILSVLSDEELDQLRVSTTKLRDSALSELGYNPQKHTHSWY